MNTTSMSPAALPTGESRKHAIEALYATASWLMSRERPYDASDVFRAMAFFAPTDERAWLGLGLCHERMGQRSTALEIYGVGGALARSVRCEIARARALREAGRTQEAEEALDRAADLADERNEGQTFLEAEREAS